MTAPTSPPTNAIDWQHLINAGHDLLNPHWTGTQPTDEHIRRAISNAYYALFHALAASNAETLVGTPYGTVTTAAWSRVYRGLDHGLARRELQRHRHEFSAECQKFVDTFGDLQNLRHSADYDHNAVFTAQEGSVALAEAEAAINDYIQADRNERTYIATVTLIRPR